MCELSNFCHYLLQISPKEISRSTEVILSILSALLMIMVRRQLLTVLICAVVWARSMVSTNKSSLFRKSKCPSDVEGPRGLVSYPSRGMYTLSRRISDALKAIHYAVRPIPDETCCGLTKGSLLF